MKQLSGVLPEGLSVFGSADQIRRGKTLQSVGVAGAIGSVLVLIAGRLITQFGGTFSALLLTLLGASLALIAWTRLWIKESKEPFQYTYSVGPFEHVEGEAGNAHGLMARLHRDLKEKLSERVGRLSLLEEGAVPPAQQPGGEPAPHVHISGWHGFRSDDDSWELEVVPEVRLGGAGASARLARSVRLRLDPSTAESAPIGKPPKLIPAGYEMLFERVYWSVASEIYAQIQIGVERKVQLLPRGSLRASAFVHEAEDYATSNTLDAYAAAQSLYRRALEIYDVRYREQAATAWRRRGSRAVFWLAGGRRALRSRAAEIWRRAGRREVMTARAELGLARMLAAEWHLGRLCGIAHRSVYEATAFVDHALERLEGLPEDVPERREVLFRARVTEATIAILLNDHPSSRKALDQAAQLIPTQAREDAEYLFAAGMAEPDRLLSLRLFGQAVALDPAMERALFHRAQEYDQIWRRRDVFEAEVAMTVDAAYRDVIKLNPGNLSAWGRRGYLGWILAEDGANADSADWRAHAVSALKTGREYKEVRREASVAELDWNMARLTAEEGDFIAAYGHYIDAVSSRLGDPRIDFEDAFYMSPTETLVKRFRRYEQRVISECEKAEQAKEVSARIVRAVKAFVLNDCGLAYQAHYERTGDGGSLTDAWNAFTDAIDANESFVLPIYNLAKLSLQRSGLPGVSGQEVDALLRMAVDLLAKVLNRESEWAPAQLLMVEVQSARAGRLKDALARDAEKGDGGAVVEPQPEEKQNALEVELEECLSSAETHLRKLLPHKQLLDGLGDTRIDAFGNRVRSLVDDEEVHWTRDFDAFHVTAFAEWADLLAITKPIAADVLCRRLRQVYCSADINLLMAHLSAAQALVEEDDGNHAALETREECLGLLREIVHAALREDPAHWVPLRASAWLTPDERRVCFTNALDNHPSATVMIWIGDAQRQMGDLELALATYERARFDGEKVDPVAALKIAALLDEQGVRGRDLITAYCQATESDDAPSAAEATIRAAQLLRQEGELEEAREEVLRMGSKPHVALYMGPRLEEEGRQEEVIEVYRGAISIEDAPDHVAELSIRLAMLLLESDEAKRSEAQTLLRGVLVGEVEEAKWKAKVLLARSLAQTDPAEAKVLYESAMTEDDPRIVAIAVAGLTDVMIAAGEEAEAKTMLDDRIAADPKVAEWLSEIVGDASGDGEGPAATADAAATPA